MPTPLQLQKAKAEAAAKVEDAKKLLAAATTDAETLSATVALTTALAAKAEAGFALADAIGGSTSAKVTHYKKLEEKTVETPEKDEEAEHDKEDEEAAEPSKSDMPEDDEEDASLAAAYAEPSNKIRASGTLDHALYTPDRLLRVVKQVTGAKTIKEAFGALDAMGTRFESVAKIEKEVAELRADNAAAKVDALLASAKKAGKVGGKEHEARLRADAKTHGPEWLKGHLAVAPQVLRTEALKPRADENGNPIFEVPADQQKLIDEACKDLPPERAEAFKKRVLAQHSATMNGASKRPSH